MEIDVRLCSTSKLKKNALTWALRDLPLNLPPYLDIMISKFNIEKGNSKGIGIKRVSTDVLRDTIYQITVVDSGSDINEQPEGLEETSLGAENRVKNAVKLYEMSGIPTYPLFIAAESGIFYENGKYFDRICTYIQEGVGSDSFFSEHFDKENGIEVPYKYVAEARYRGFKNTTWAMVMAEEMSGVDPKDPHKSLVGVSRSLFLKEALLKALERHTFSSITVEQRTKFIVANKLFIKKI